LKPFIRRVATGEEESRDRTTPETDEEMGVASTGREILGEHYDDEHLTYEEIRGLGLGVVTEKGETVPTDELQGKIRHPPGGAAGRRPDGARGGRPGTGVPVAPPTPSSRGSRGSHVGVRMAGSWKR
jgi:hypothetical protein